MTFEIGGIFILTRTNLDLKINRLALRTGRGQQRPSAPPASGRDGYYAVVDDWRGKMAAPEDPELSQAQTEKLLQFQVRQAKFPMNTGACVATRVRGLPLTVVSKEQVDLLV